MTSNSFSIMASMAHLKVKTKLEVKTVVTEPAVMGTCRMVQGPGERGYFGQCGANAILEFENSIMIT